MLTVYLVFGFMEKPAQLQKRKGALALQAFDMCLDAPECCGHELRVFDVCMCKL